MLVHYLEQHITYLPRGCNNYTNFIIPWNDNLGMEDRQRRGT